MADITTTKDKFGVPLADGSPAGILMPKLKFRFRVTLSDRFGSATGQTVLTQNVQNVTRPKLTHEEVIIESYNSKVYVSGKHTWDPVTIIVRDDIRNKVVQKVGQQLQKQIDHYNQIARVAGDDYKFNAKIEILDGSHADSTEVWRLEGCFIQNIDYSDSDYSANDPVTVTMTLRFDNAYNIPGDGANQERAITDSIMQTEDHTTNLNSNTEGLA
tara:strand:+ start:825 stop:1469 length:645 start_codon:yes stop_codon:yes gene_type:complete